MAGFRRWVKGKSGTWHIYEKFNNSWSFPISRDPECKKDDQLDMMSEMRLVSKLPIHSVCIECATKKEF